MPRLVILPLLALIGACASTTTVDTRYVAPDTGPALQRILLVAHTPEAAMQEEWETTCARKMARPGLEVVPSHTVATLGYSGGSEPLLRWAQENEAGGILLGELTQLLLAPLQVPPRDFMRPDREMNGGLDAPTVGITLGRQEPEPRMDHRLGFRLIRADGAILWDGITETHEANDIEAIAASQCAAIAETLTRLGLIAP